MPDTITVTITNAGFKAQVVHVPGGTLTVKPGSTLKDVAIYPLTADRVRHYAERGVLFSGRGVPKTPAQEAQARRAAEEAAARKAAEEEAARKAAEEEVARKVAEEEAAHKAAQEQASRKAAK